jgi:hypothetical protein
VKAYGGAQLGLKLYTAAGPYMRMNGYLKLAADTRATPWWTLKAGLEASMGASIGINASMIHWNKDWKSGNLGLGEWTLAQATPPPPPPPSGVVPHITSISPNRASISGGDITLTIGGSGFVQQDRSTNPPTGSFLSLWFTTPSGSSTALALPDITSFSPTRLAVVVPIGAFPGHPDVFRPGVYRVRVDNSFGLGVPMTVSNEVDFTVDP